MLFPDKRHTALHMYGVLNIDVITGGELHRRRQRVTKIIVDNNSTIQLNVDTFNQTLQQFLEGFLVIDLQLCKAPDFFLDFLHDTFIGFTLTHNRLQDGRSCLHSMLFIL